MEFPIIKRKKEEEPVQRQSVRRLTPPAELGLSSAEAAERTRCGWVNETVSAGTKTVGEIVKGNLFTYFNLVFAVLAALLIVVGSFRSLTFLPVVLANLLIGIIQEFRAKKTLDELTVLSSPRVTAIRDGVETEVAAEALVLDDIVIFRAGSQICADAVVVSGAVSVNEALLTGEADEVAKQSGDALKSGSFVVSGECRARLDKVGRDSYASRLTLEAKAMGREERSEMIRVLDKLVGVVGIIIVPIGIALFVQQFAFAHAPFRDSIESMVAAVIGMIPEGLYLLASVALAVSVMRLARQRVLVHDMKCIETLARVDVLCVDKTGTITENEMRAEGAVPLYGYDEAAMGPLEALLGDFAAAQPEDNITMAALKRRFPASGSRQALRTVPFSSAYKFSGAVFDDGAYVLGAPEIVLRAACEESPDLAAACSAGSYRVLALGRCEGALEAGALEGEVTPLALVYLFNPVREGAAETFEYFAAQGVEIKVISGDNPATVSQVALQAGIEGAERYIDASRLHDAEALRAAAEEYTVFGRVTPEQKRLLIQSLKAAGHTVAMTGDGVNDVLAMKDADCSVAMASGCDAAAHVSQLVLLDSDFAAMPSIVAEGRRVVNNIERSASLFLVKNLFSLLMSVFSVCFMLNYPLEPAQISLISMFTIGIPAFFLALQPNESIIQGRFLSNVLLRALPAGLTDFLVVGALVVFGRVFGVDGGELSTACTMLLAIVGFIILYNISKPMNTWRWCLWGGCVAGLLLGGIGLSDLFGIQFMSTRCVMLFVVFAIITEPAMRYGTQFVGWVYGRVVKWREKRASVHEG